MKSIAKWMLAAAVVAGGLGLGATKADAQIGIYVRAGRPAAYIPPSPGPGYVWVNGYYDAYGNYVDGYWNYAGVTTYAPTTGVYLGYRGGWDRDRDWDRERHWDHERREHEWREHEYREHGGDRGEHRGWGR